MHLFKLGVQHHLTDVYSLADLQSVGGDSMFTWEGA
jgi:hypothetical protein